MISRCAGTCANVWRVDREKELKKYEEDKDRKRGNKSSD